MTYTRQLTSWKNFIIKLLSSMLRFAVDHYIKLILLQIYYHIEFLINILNKKDGFIILIINMKEDLQDFYIADYFY